MSYSYEKESVEVYQLKCKLLQAKEELGTYQGLYAANFVEINNLKQRIGRLKNAQRKAHLEYKGMIE